MTQVLVCSQRPYHHVSKKLYISWDIRMQWVSKYVYVTDFSPAKDKFLLKSKRLSHEPVEQNKSLCRDHY